MTSRLSDRAAHGLAHATRRHALRAMATSEKSPSAIARSLGTGIEATSHHITTLCRLGLIEQSRTEAHHGTLTHFYVLTGDGRRTLEVARRLDRLDRPSRD